MDKFIDRIKEEWDRNPLTVLAVGTGLVTAVTMLMNARTAQRNSRSWSREVDRRYMKGH